MHRTQKSSSTQSACAPKRLSSLGLTCCIVAAICAASTACSETEVRYVDEVDDARGQDAGSDASPLPDSRLARLTFRPERAFSGFDGTHAFTVPVAVYGAADDLVVTATDPSTAEIVPKKLANPSTADGTVDDGKYFFVTVKSSQTITLKATSNGGSAEMKVTVTPYSAERWEAGEARYKSPSGGDPPCTNCHVSGRAVDHSPAALSTVADEALSTAITIGVSTGGFPIKINGAPGHSWKVTAAEREGLVTYLRSLEPRGFE